MQKITKRKFLHVGFLVRKLRTNRYSVSCKISIGADKGTPFATGIILDKKENWHNPRGYATTILGEGAKAKNECLAQIKQDIELIYNRLVSLKKPVTSSILETVYLGQEVPSISILKLYEDYTNEQLKKERKPNTKSGYKRYYKDFESFCNEKKLLFYPACEFTKLQAKEYFEYLKLIPNSDKIAWRKVRSVKMALEQAMEFEIIEKSKLSKLSIKIRNEKKPLVFLFSDEVARIENKVFDVERLERIKDLFLFQCYTGLHYSEMAMFDAKEHLFWQNGVQWISFDRMKTAAYIGIPVFETTLRVLQKYDFKLPVLSNGNYNLYLKELAVACGIRKELTTKVGRKTFTNYMLNVQKVSKDVVARLLSHSSVTITEQYYGDIDQNRILAETQHLLPIKPKPNEPQKMVSTSNLNFTYSYTK